MYQNDERACQVQVEAWQSEVDERRREIDHKSKKLKKTKKKLKKTKRKLKEEKSGYWGEKKKTKKKVKILKKKIAHLEQSLEVEKSRYSDMEREFNGERELIQLQMNNQFQGWVLEILAREFVPVLLDKYGLPGKRKEIPEIVN